MSDNREFQRYNDQGELQEQLGFLVDEYLNSKDNSKLDTLKNMSSDLSVVEFNLFMDGLNVRFRNETSREKKILILNIKAGLLNARKENLNIPYPEAPFERLDMLPQSVNVTIKEGNMIKKIATRGKRELSLARITDLILIKNEAKEVVLTLKEKGGSIIKGSEIVKLLFVYDTVIGRINIFYIDNFDKDSIQLIDYISPDLRKRRALQHKNIKIPGGGSFKIDFQW